MTFLNFLSMAALLWGLATLQLCRAQSRITGGDPVQTNRFQYVATLRIMFTENGEQFFFFCSGALITSNVVLVGSMKWKLNSHTVVPFDFWLILRTPLVFFFTIDRLWPNVSNTPNLRFLSHSITRALQGIPPLN